MIRRLTTLLAVALCALGITATSALAAAPAPYLSEGVNYQPMQCFGLAEPFSATIKTATTVTKSDAKVQRDGSVVANVKAGILVTVEPNDPAGVTYIGGASVSQRAVVPADTQTVEIPVTIPVVGSDATLSAAATVEMIFTTDVSGKNAQVAVVTGDIVCGDAVPTPTINVADETKDAFKDLVHAAGGPAAAQFLSSSIAQFGASVIGGTDLGNLAKGLGDPRLAKTLKAMAKLFQYANDKAQQNS